jgi:hypothetical protein
MYIGTALTNGFTRLNEKINRIFLNNLLKILFASLFFKMVLNFSGQSPVGPHIKTSSDLPGMVLRGKAGIG